MFAQSWRSPKQTVDFDEMMAKSNSGNLDIDENFYGDQDFDMEDFDPEGFDMGGAPHRTLMSKKTINLNGGGR